MICVEEENKSRQDTVGGQPGMWARREGQCDGSVRTWRDLPATEEVHDGGLNKEDIY